MENISVIKTEIVEQWNCTWKREHYFLTDAQMIEFDLYYRHRVRNTCLSSSNGFIQVGEVRDFAISD